MAESSPSTGTAQPRTTTGSSEPSKPQQRVLVVGDWVIDEHWVTSIHRSKTRSRAGVSHYRSIQEPDGCVLTLAGAGKTASILHEALADSHEKRGCFEVLGAGIWYHDDESTLWDLLTPDKARGQTHHRLTYPPPARPPSDIRLFNLHDATSGRSACCGTTRVIRIYQQTGTDYVLLDRIDWEVPHECKGAMRSDTTVRRLSQSLRQGVDAVVLNDMGKGVVDSGLVKWLRKELKQTGPNLAHPAWFVCSKKWLPAWTDDLPKHAVELFLVPQVAANSAAEDLEFSRWFTGDGSVTKEALAKIENLGSKFPKALICVLPRGLSVIARTNGQNNLGLLTQIVEGDGLVAEGVPMASVFLPTLSALLMRVGSQAAGSVHSAVQEFETPLKTALAFTETWMRKEVRRISEPKTWHPDQKEQRLILSSATRSYDQNDGQLFLPRWTRESWQKCVDEWQQAYRDRGIVRVEDRSGNLQQVLDIKRAMVEVDGYVCCVEAKRQVLRRLNAEVQTFSPGDGVSKAFMLKADPGCGKSYLIAKLAELHRLQLLAFNITSLLNRSDRLDCFDTIVTTQSRARYKKYLVFFDEINAHLDNDAVYDAFLRPLEEGLYVRAGKSFYVDPCVWIFAGTADPSSRGSGSSNSPSSSAAKGSDFVSRLSDTPFQLESGWTQANEFKTSLDTHARLENIYAGAALIKHVFPDVTHVEENVLEAFRVMPPMTPIRKIGRLVRRFEQVQYGKVRTGNLPKDWLKFMEVSSAGVDIWNKQSPRLTGQFVRVL